MAPVSFIVDVPASKVKLVGSVNVQLEEQVTIDDPNDKPLTDVPEPENDTHDTCLLLVFKVPCAKDKETEIVKLSCNVQPPPAPLKLMLATSTVTPFVVIVLPVAVE